MSDLRDVLEREARRVDGPPDAWRNMVRRADRRRTARRVGTAVMALAVAAGGSFVAFRGLGPTADVRPAAAPETLTAEIAGVSIDYPPDWTLLDVRHQIDDEAPPSPLPSPVLEILNVTGQSCLNARGTPLPETAVILQVAELTEVPDRLPAWPVSLERESGSSFGCGQGQPVFRDHHASWRASGRHFSATLGVGPDASRADIDAAFAAFSSLRFEDGWGPFLEFSAGPRQVVNSGPAWIAHAFEAGHGELCVHVQGERIRGDTVGAACELTVTARQPLDFSTKTMDDGRVAFGAVTPEASRVIVNGVEARMVTPLDRYGVEYKLFAAFVPPSSAVEIEAFDEAGRSIVVAGRTFSSAAASPPPPVETPAPLTPEDRSARAFVEDFAAARIAGENQEALRRFLSDEARTAYAEGRDGLSLYEEPDAGPYSGFEVPHVEELSASTHAVSLGMSVETGACVETFYEELVVRVAGDEVVIVAASRPDVIATACPASP